MIHRFKIGEFECMVIQDYSETIIDGLDRMFVNIEPEIWQTAKKELGERPDEAEFSYNCLGINTGQQWILIDTGSGVLREGTRLRAILEDEGIVPDSIIITHAHLDHYGGLVDGDGQPIYPNAVVYVCEDEWNFYTGEGFLGQSGERADILRRYFMGVKDQIELVTCDATIAPGVRMVPAPGHTMHHVGLWIESEGEKLLVTADAYPHLLHVTHPGWHFFRDIDKERAQQSRITLAKMAIESDALVHAYHFEFPGLGHIAKTDAGYRWITLGG